MADYFYDNFIIVIGIVVSIAVFVVIVFLPITKMMDSYSCGPVQSNVSDCNCSNAPEKSEVRYLYCEEIFVSSDSGELVCKVNIFNGVVK